MKVAIAGAHGQIALRLARLLAAAGDRVIGLIRNPGHATEVSRAGAAPVLCDLERASVEEITGAIMGADAVVFAAGAGSGSGAGRKLTMDRDGAIKLLRAATAAGIPRYLMISGAGVENPPDGDGVFEVYLRAKAEADAALEASDRDWTILRPGGLTNDAGTGKVRIGSVPHFTRTEAVGADYGTHTPHMHSRCVVVPSTCRPGWCALPRLHSRLAYR